MFTTTNSSAKKTDWNLSLRSAETRFRKTVVANRGATPPNYGVGCVTKIGQNGKRWKIEVVFSNIKRILTETLTGKSEK